MPIVLSALHLAVLLQASQGNRQGYQCAAVQTIPRSIEIGTRYRQGDKSFSVVDPAREANERTKRAPISQPVAHINELSDALARTPADNPLHAKLSLCLARHLQAQARAGAMLEAESIHAFFLRSWMITSIALAYLKARDSLSPHLNDQELHTWLQQSASSLVVRAERQIERTHIDNHSYWAGLAAMAVGRAVDDGQLVLAARSIRSRGLATVRSDGLLPAELIRGPRSYHYHLFSAAPLAMMIELDPAPAPKVELRAMRRLSDMLATDFRNPKGAIWRANGAVQLKEQQMPLYYPALNFMSAPLRGRISGELKDVPCKYQYLGGEFCRWLTPIKS